MVGHEEAESHFQKLMTCLSHPPSYTCVRASTHLAPLEEIKLKLAEELRKVVVRYSGRVDDHSGQYSQREEDDNVVVVVEAADVQLIGRGGARADSHSPADSRCAAASCGRAPV